jgi:N-acetylneuraminic acid mutarotase
MKRQLLHILITAFAGAILFNACRKEKTAKGDVGINQPPVADAGRDAVQILPENSLNLTGGGSYDPDDDIVSYRWSKISGPSSFSIVSKDSAQTQVKDLVEGIYQFELTVSDAGGLFSRDTVKSTISNGFAVVACDNSVRQIVAAQLIPLHHLTETRNSIATASADGKILFAGGYTDENLSSSTVDIFDVNANSWSRAALSEPRSGIATVVLGNKIFLAGGANKSASYSSVVDIYDAGSNTWSTSHLSAGRTQLVGAATNDKVLFAGGYDFAGPKWSAPPVDIYDRSTDMWTTDHLRNRPTSDIIGDAGITATVIGSKIYFAGNASDWWAWDFGSITSTINIFDASDNTWSTAEMDMPRGYHAAIAVGSKIYWAGGLYKQPPNPFTDHVEIRDVATGLSTSGCLFQPNAFFSAVLKNNYIVFFTRGVSVLDGHWTTGIPVLNKFDIYDLTTDSWYIGILPFDIEGSSIISVDNSIYVAGGKIDGVLSDQVWKLNW